MKTVMKKLLSLMLVAVLLVSAVPFASAAEGDYTFWFELWVDNQRVDNKDKTLSVAPNTTFTEDQVKEYAKQFWPNYFNGGYTVIDVTESLVADQDNNGVRILLQTVTCDHAASKLTTTNTATCGAAGVKTVTCECGEVISTEDVPATGNHNYVWTVTTPATTTSEGVETGTCSCGATTTRSIAKNTVTVTFRNELAGKINESSLTMYQTVSSSDLPVAPDVKGYDFKGWFSGKNGTGDKLASGYKWTGEYTTYYAYYEESIQDNVSTLSVWVRFYVGGVQNGNTMKLYDHDFTDGDNMLTWLVNNESTTANAIFNIRSSDDYEWTPRYYYEYSGSEPLAEQDLIADGDKDIVVKVYSKKTTEANVLLYVHTSKTSSPANIYEMTGYTAGNTVTLSATKTLVKKHYTGSSMTISGLYTDTTWAQLLNGENPTAANGIEVADNGTLRIHVLVKNGTATNGSNETADSTNPKTGDMIFVPMIFMLASAAAVAMVYAYNKKRIVK